MTFKMIFMIRLPWFTTHVTETFSAQTLHKIATCRPLNSFITPGTYFSINSDPLSISLLFKNQIYPFFLLLTRNRRMIIIFTFKTEEFSASALYRSCMKIFAFNAISAVSSWTTLIAGIYHCKLLTD